MSSKETSRTYSDEELLAAFVGYRAETMVPKMQRQAWFNVFAFLFGPVYYAYRKLYPHAVVILLVQLAVSAASVIYSDMFSEDFFRLLNIVLGLACGILFYTLYRQRALSVIERERSAESALPVNRRVAAVGETSPLAAVVTLVASFATVFALAAGITAYRLSTHISSKEAVAYDIERAIDEEVYLISVEERTGNPEQVGHLTEEEIRKLAQRHPTADDFFNPPVNKYRANLEVLNGLQDELATIDDADGAAIRAIHQRIDETMDDTLWCAFLGHTK